MLSDPRDSGAYRTAIASIGLALAVVLVGVCTIKAVGQHVPCVLWFIGSAAGGVLVGTLIPFSLRSTHSHADKSFASKVFNVPWESLLLVVILGVVLVLSATNSFGRSFLLHMLGVAIGGVLLGLLIPSPGQRDW